MRRFAGIGVAALAAVILLAAAGCASGSKAGGSAEGNVSVLTLVSENDVIDPPLHAYANAVARRSHGTLRIQFQLNYRPNDLQVETHLIQAVQRGKEQLAWVGARTWELFGVDSFRPLLAPFLIDSYPLEQRVLTSRLAGQMLAGLRGHGVVGLAVLPGPLRRAEGRKPLRRPADFRGIDFGTYPVPLDDATLRALGARPFALSRQTVNQLPRNAGGLESFFRSIYGDEYFRRLPFVSMNVSLWPRPLVIFANAKVYRSLSPAQQQALRLAGTDAVAPSITSTKLDESPAGDTNLCSAEQIGFPLHLIEATPGDLAALRHVVQPVYTMLERDPQERAVITRIESLKRALDVPPDAGLPCAHVPLLAARTPSPLDAVYRQHVTLQQAAARDHIPASQEDPANYGDTVWVYDRGRFAYTQRSDRACSWAYGRFAVKKNQLAMTFADGAGFGTQAVNKPGETFRGRWSLYRNVLTLTFTYPAPGPPPPESLTRVSATPSPGALFANKHCQLPARALR